MFWKKIYLWLKLRISQYICAIARFRHIFATHSVTNSVCDKNGQLHIWIVGSAAWGTPAAISYKRKWDKMPSLSISWTTMCVFNLFIYPPFRFHCSCSLCRWHWHSFCIILITLPLMLIVCRMWIKSEKR